MRPNRDRKRCMRRPFIGTHKPCLDSRPLPIQRPSLLPALRGTTAASAPYFHQPTVTLDKYNDDDRTDDCFKSTDNLSSHLRLSPSDNNNVSDLKLPNKLLDPYVQLDDYDVNDTGGKREDTVINESDDLQSGLKPMVSYTPSLTVESDTIVSGTTRNNEYQQFQVDPLAKQDVADFRSKDMFGNKPNVVSGCTTKSFDNGRHIKIPDDANSKITLHRSHTPHFYPGNHQGPYVKETYLPLRNMNGSFRRQSLSSQPETAFMVQNQETYHSGEMSKCPFNGNQHGEYRLKNPDNIKNTSCQTNLSETNEAFINYTQRLNLPSNDLERSMYVRPGSCINDLRKPSNTDTPSNSSEQSTGRRRDSLNEISPTEGGRNGGSNNYSPETRFKNVMPLQQSNWRNNHSVPNGAPKTTHTYRRFSQNVNEFPSYLQHNENLRQNRTNVPDSNSKRHIYVSSDVNSGKFQEKPINIKTIQNPSDRCKHKLYLESNGRIANIYQDQTVTSSITRQIPVPNITQNIPFPNETVRQRKKLEKTLMNLTGTNDESTNSSPHQASNVRDNISSCVLETSRRVMADTRGFSAGKDSKMKCKIFNRQVTCLCPEDDESQCNKQEPCTRIAGTSTCASTTCVEKLHHINLCQCQITGCSCRYPPAYKQFSCAGNISGGCTCSEETKLKQINTFF